MKLNYLPLLNFDHFHADHKNQRQNVSTIHPHPSTNIFRMIFSSWYSRKDRAGCTEALRWALDASGGQMPLLAFKLYRTKLINIQEFRKSLHNFELREAPDKKMPGLFGHCPNGEGGPNTCPDGLLRQLRHLKKVPQSARLSVERGVQKLIGQCPNAFCANVRPPESVRIYLPAELSGGLQLKKTPCR